MQLVMIKAIVIAITSETKLSSDHWIQGMVYSRSENSSQRTKYTLCVGNR